MSKTIRRRPSPVFRRYSPNSGMRSRAIAMKTDDAAKPFMELVSKGSVSLQQADLFNGIDITGENGILEPEFNYRLLLGAAKQNSALPQCIQAYVVNIESYGYQLEYVGPEGKEKKPLIQNEKNRAISFLDNVSGDKSLRQIRETSRTDLEYLGDRYFEIGSDQLGRPTFMGHIPTITLRRTKKDKTATTYTVQVRNPDGTIGKITRSKKFCRYVQAGANGTKVFFKEFGDPRPIDPKTGKPNASLPIEGQATEVFNHSLYSTGSLYGAPRWIGALPDMLGVRESELVNLNFFRENCIPAMALLISGGGLTEESYDKVVNLINAARGKDAHNRFLILEAVSDDTMMGTDQAPPAPRFEMKPLGEMRQNDAQWGEYQKEGKRKVRASMRLPALYTGDTEEYTKATAQSGIRIAESQVFQPERSLFDEFVNNRLFPRLGITNWAFKSVGPPVYDPDTLSTMIDRFGRHGAMTPNILIKIANKVLDVQIPLVQDKWGDIPFVYTMGMVNAGMQVDKFEDIFATINDAANTGEGNEGETTGNVPPVSGAANDNAQAKAVRRIIRQELVSMTDDIIDRINQNAAAA